MTHEELLAKIKPALHRPEFCANCACGAEFKEMHKLSLHIEEANNAYIWALNKIVALHFQIKDAPICDQCMCDYPCPTIQAIEKELK